MTEKINWKRELSESGKFNDKFSKNILEHEAKTLCKESILYIFIPNGKKIRGLDKDDPVENTGQMKSSYKEFEKKIK